MSEKLILVGFLSLFDPGAWEQIFVAVLVALCTFILHARVAPFRRKNDNLFAFISAAMLVLVLLGTLALQTEALAPELKIDSTFIALVLFVATLLVLVAAFGFFAAGARSLPYPS